MRQEMDLTHLYVFKDMHMLETLYVNVMVVYKKTPEYTFSAKVTISRDRERESGCVTFVVKER